MKQNLINLLVCGLLMMSGAACGKAKGNDRSDTKVETQSQDSVKSDVIGKTFGSVKEELKMYDFFSMGAESDADYSFGALSVSDVNFQPQNLRIFLVKGMSEQRGMYDGVIVDELLFDKNTTDIFGTEPVVDINTGIEDIRFIRYKMVDDEPVLVNLYDCKDGKIIAVDPPKNLQIQFYEP